LADRFTAPQLSRPWSKPCCGLMVGPSRWCPPGPRMTFGRSPTARLEGPTIHPACAQLADARLSTGAATVGCRALADRAGRRSGCSRSALFTRISRSVSIAWKRRALLCCGRKIMIHSTGWKVLSLTFGISSFPSRCRFKVKCFLGEFPREGQ